MSQLTITETIRLGDISVPLALNYQANGDLFGKRMAFTAPQTIAVVTDALRWQWAAFPSIPEVRAIASLTIDTIGDTGDIITVNVNDPTFGLITLGSYTLVDSDTTTDIIAANLAAVLVNNIYGYAITVSVSQLNMIYVTAAEFTGAAINGNNLIVVVTPIGYLSTQGDEPLITENNYNIITQ